MAGKIPSVVVAFGRLAARALLDSTVTPAKFEALDRRAKLKGLEIKDAVGGRVRYRAHGAKRWITVEVK